MLLKTWRAEKGLTIEQATEFTGTKSAGAFSDLERGVIFASPETIIRIDGATYGAVTALDHLRAWRAAHAIETKKFRTAGRAAARRYLARVRQRR